MRCAAALVLILSLAPSAYAAKPQTVQELRTLLETHTRDSDKNLAHRLVNIPLSQQLTPATLTKLVSDFHLGPKSAEALSLVADESAFGDPPPEEMPQREPPSDAVARDLLASGIRYAGTALKRMPNFTATRSTARFDDVPFAYVTADGFAAVGDLHPASSSVEQIAFAGGKQVQSGASDAPEAPFHWQPVAKLSSQGEFGPIFGVLLRDLPSGSAKWSHWEQLPTGIAAVFSFTVPEPASHFHIEYCCVPALRMVEHNISERPAYHGRVFLDPESGTILRIIIQADFKHGHPIRRADLLVDYAPVQLGGATFYTPSRTLALLDALTLLPYGDDLIRHVNRSTFTNYRRFGSEMRILP